MTNFTMRLLYTVFSGILIGIILILCGINMKDSPLLFIWLAILGNGFAQYLWFVAEDKQ